MTLPLKGVDVDNRRPAVSLVESIILYSICFTIIAWRLVGCLTE